jgi:beta-lactamase regulating signal transducer with metallopeptidase domain
MSLLETVFEWVVSTTLRASGVALAILAIQLLLRPWLPAKWRHPLWLPLLLVMVLPFVPVLPLHPIPARPAVPVPPSGELVATTAGEATPAPTTNLVAPAPRVTLPLLPLLWLAGVLVTLTAGVTGYRRKLKAIRAHAVSPAPDLQIEIDDARRTAGLSRTPVVWLSREVASPAVSGLWRPVLLLPAGFPAAFTAAEARLILLHEFSHLKRHDLAQNWLLFALQALHWFNPLIWFAFARLRLDRETACDARVLALDAVDRRAEYGHALLKMQELPATGGLRLGFLGIFENVTGLRSRITDISRHRRSHPAWQVAGCGLVTLIALFGSTRAQEVAPATKEAEVNEAKLEPKSGAELVDAQAAIIKKLDSLIIPQVSFEDTSLEEAIAFVRLRSTELDTAERDPNKKGVNFVIRKPRGIDGQPAPVPARVTFEMKDAPLRRILGEIARQSGMRMKIEDEFAVTFVPADEKDLVRNEAEAAAKVAPPVGPKAVANENKLQVIIIPVVDLEDVTLADAVKFFNARAKELSKDKPVPPIKIGPKTKGELRIKELRLRNVPLSIALKYCAESAKVPLTFNDEGAQIGW